MGAATNIEWARNTDGSKGATWNPVTGCDDASPGCQLCYARSIATRFAGTPAFPNSFAVTLHPERLTIPLKRRKSTTYFVNSMSDVFHKDIPDEFIAEMFAVMAATPRHTFQILTKRHGRMRSLLNNADWRSEVFARESTIDNRGPARPLPAWPLPNVHLGVSTENQQWADIRIPALLDTPAAIRWISAEPLLGPVDLFGPIDQYGGRAKLTYWLHGRPYWDEPRPEPTSPNGILVRDLKTAPALDWVVVGGESGPGARPMDLDWVRSIRDQCAATETPIFVKQLGTVWAKQNHATSRKAGDPLEWPEDLRIRQIPEAAR